MPRREGPVRHLHELPIEERKAQDGQFQAHWYTWLADYLESLNQQCTVLDVGAGNGYGLKILGRRPEIVTDVGGIDPLPMGPGVARATLGCSTEFHVSVGTARARTIHMNFGSDWACAIDVIEHIEEDEAFVWQLAKIARRGIFITTPNWDATHCANEFHLREYTPAELDDLLHRALGKKEQRWLGATADGVIEEWNGLQPNIGVLVQW